MKKILYITMLFIAACTSEKTERQASVDFCSSIHLDNNAGLSSQLDSLIPQMEKNTGVYILEEGDASMVARAWLCENAEKTIDVQYFIFSTDNVGLIAADYLVRAADRGVKVRILIDDILVEADEEKLLTLDSHKNIRIKIYNAAVNVGKNAAEKVLALKGDFWGTNQRMHNKTFTVDGTVTITGGRNIADEYFDYDHEYNFRDRDVLLLGGVVKDVEKSFEKFWNSPISKMVTDLVNPSEYKVGPEPFKELHNYACDSNNFWPQVRTRIMNVPQAFKDIRQSGKFQWVENVTFVSDLPGKNNESLKSGGITTDTLMALIRSARKSVLIQSPYLVTTEKGKELLADAVKRGVEIKILTNSLASTDNLPAFNGYQRDRELLLKTGVRIFEFKPDALIRYKIMTGSLQKAISYKPVFGIHAKTMIVDDEITVVGTFNFDPRSAYLNTECITLIYSEKIAKEVREGIEEEMKPENSWETTLNFNPDSEASLKKRMQMKPMKLIPKDIL
jgi:phosphatidylserine/phosphatidylglycerophosphate/cardiolipin synthase-like enzyme